MKVPKLKLPKRKPRKRSNQIVWLVLMATCLTFLIGQSGCQRASVRKGEVVGDSMVPFALGEHWRLDCKRCGDAFSVQPSISTTREFLVCPNCGFDKVPIESADEMPADLVEISLSPKTIQRWNVVAFQSMTSSKAGIKRVVGLPGESIEIRSGNLFANGLLLRKELDTQREIRVPVYDSKFSNTEFPRWVGIGWQKTPSGFVWEKQSSSTPLSYLHRDCYVPGAGKPGPALLEDTYGFNQFLPRGLNTTDEIFIEAEFENSKELKFGCRFKTGDDQFDFEFDLGLRIVRMKKNDQALVTSEIPGDLGFSETTTFEFSSFDRKIVAAINQDIVFEFELEPDVPLNIDSKIDVAKDVFGILPFETDICLKRIRIWRDIYYLGASNKVGAEQTLATSPGYILLGDNVPVSLDSRHWGHGISEGEIIGVVKLSESP
jgi:hypothetical protein